MDCNRKRGGVVTRLELDWSGPSSISFWGIGVVGLIGLFATTGLGQEPKGLQGIDQPELLRTVSAPRRITPMVQQAPDYLPPQRPIGQVAIGLTEKPSKGNDSLPENLGQRYMSGPPSVRAARSDEMANELGLMVNRSRNEWIAHQPLYFEEANLERYGRTRGPLQPGLSGVRFLGTIPALPYAMAVQHPNKVYQTRWPYEAGWGAPRVKELRFFPSKPSSVQPPATNGLGWVVPWGRSQKN